MLVWSPVLVPDTAVVPVTESVGVEAPEIATVLYFPAVMSPVVSAMVTAESCKSFPVVVSNRATALSVAEAGQTTSHEADAVLAIVTMPSAPVPVVVSVILLPSTSFTLPPEAESVTVWEVPSEEFVTVWSPVLVPLVFPITTACASVT